MIQNTTTRINKKGLLSLPLALAKKWANQDLVLMIDEERLIAQPLDSRWNRYEQKLKTKGKKISSKLVDEAVNWARK